MGKFVRFLILAPLAALLLVAIGDLIYAVVRPGHACEHLFCYAAGTEVKAEAVKYHTSLYFCADHDLANSPLVRTNGGVYFKYGLIAVFGAYMVIGVIAHLVKRSRGPG